MKWRLSFTRSPSSTELRHAREVEERQRHAARRRRDFEVRALASGLTPEQVAMFLEYFALSDHKHLHHASDVVPYFTSEPIE